LRSREVASRSGPTSPLPVRCLSRVPFDLIADRPVTPHARRPSLGSDCLRAVTVASGAIGCLRQQAWLHETWQCNVCHRNASVCAQKPVGKSQQSHTPSLLQWNGDTELLATRRALTYRDASRRSCELESSSGDCFLSGAVSHRCDYTRRADRALIDGTRRRSPDAYAFGWPMNRRAEMTRLGRFTPVDKASSRRRCRWAVPTMGSNTSPQLAARIFHSD